MGEKAWNAEVVSVDSTANKLAVKQRKFTAGKATEIPLTFIVSATTQIKDKVGNVVKFTDIQVGKKVAVEYVKGIDGSLTAQTIKVG